MIISFLFLFYVGFTLLTSQVQVIHMHFHTTPPFNLGNQTQRKLQEKIQEEGKMGDYFTLLMEFWLARK